MRRSRLGRRRSGYGFKHWCRRRRRRGRRRRGYCVRCRCAVCGSMRTTGQRPEPKLLSRPDGVRRSDVVPLGKVAKIDAFAERDRIQRVAFCHLVGIAWRGSVDNRRCGCPAAGRFDHDRAACRESACHHHRSKPRIVSIHARKHNERPPGFHAVNGPRSTKPGAHRAMPTRPSRSTRCSRAAAAPHAHRTTR